MRRNRLYILLFTVTLCGYVWIVYCMNHPTGQGLWQGCLTKQFLHVPCPSCGTTRSLMCILNGEWTEALTTNPLGYLAATLLLVTPAWICLDLILDTDSLWRTYNTTISLIQRRAVYVPLVMLLLANWIWNIMKFT